MSLASLRGLSKSPALLKFKKKKKKEKNEGAGVGGGESSARQGPPQLQHRWPVLLPHSN